MGIIGWTTAHKFYLKSLIGAHDGGGSWKDTLVAVGGKVLETVAIAAGRKVYKQLLNTPSNA